MSEIRKTTTIEKVDAPAPEPLITLGDILAGVGWLAFQGTKLAVKGAVAGSVLAYQGARAISKTVQDARHARLSIGEIAPLVSEAQDASRAVASLATHAGLEIPQAQAEQWKTRIEKLVASNDKPGALKLARELIGARQDRLQTTVLKLAADTCKELGFKAVPLRSEHGLLVAKSDDEKRTLSIEVQKTKDGEIRLHFDADGFHGGTCIQTLNAFENGLRARGVRFAVSERHRKDRRPVFDGRRLPQAIRARIRR